MNITKNKRNLLVCISAIASLFSSCSQADMDRLTFAEFKNSTNDTLFVGVSSYNTIDSVGWMLEPLYSFEDSIVGNDKDSCLLNEFYADRIYPDSVGKIYDYMLFDNSDTCYFFLIKYEDAKNHSLDEIRAKKLYKKWKVVRKKYGGYDRNIRYSE